MDLRLRTYLLLAISVPTLMSLMAINMSLDFNLEEVKYQILIWYACLVPIYLLLYGFLFGEGYRLFKRDPAKTEIPELHYVSSRICFFAMASCILVLYAASLWLVGRDEYVYLLYLIVPVMLLSLVCVLFRKRRRIGDHLPSTQIAAVIFVSMIALIPSYLIQNQEEPIDEVEVQVDFDIVNVQAPMVDGHYNLNIINELFYVEEFDTGFPTFGYESDRIRSGIWMSHENLYFEEFTLAGYKSCDTYIIIVDSDNTAIAFNQETEEDTKALYDRLAIIHGDDASLEPDENPDESESDEPLDDRYRSPIPFSIFHADSLGMAKLTPEIKELMKGQRIFAFATASKDGVPNVVPVGMLFVAEDDSIWLVDNFLNKTLANLKENPRASFYIWYPDCGESYQVKCSAEVLSSGPDYEKAKAFAHSIKETYPAKNLVRLTVEDVYYVTPGDHAGKKF